MRFRTISCRPMLLELLSADIDMLPVSLWIRREGTECQVDTKPSEHDILGYSQHAGLDTCGHSCLLIDEPVLRAGGG